MEKRSFCCRGDRTVHYKSEVPRTLQPFVDYVFSSGGVVGDDFRSFATKFRNAVKKLLPNGCELHKWNNGHYYCSAFIKTAEGGYIYMSIPDVRFFPNEWFSNILIRQAKSDEDYHGGTNHHTTIFSMNRDIQRLYQ